MIQSPICICPQFESDDFAAGYINFYLVNGAVTMPEFGDAIADNQAKLTLQTLFPARAIGLLKIDAIAAGGGGMHCITQQPPHLP